MSELTSFPESNHPQRIFITGASGCIGHYLVETLLTDTPHQLFLLVRNPDKLMLTWQGNARIQIIQDDIRNIDAYADLLATIDTAVLAATSWGGAPEIYDINVTGNHKLMSLLDRDRCQQVVYFSTASILDRHNLPLKEADEIGTDYIRSKYQCYLKLPELAIYPKITTVFPTLVFGGDKDKPYSHISAGIQDVTKWMGLIRFLKADGSFHFAHGKDIALVVSHLINHPPAPQEPRQVIIGNPALTINRTVEEVCDYLGLRIFFRIPLSLWLADRIIDGFNIRMAEWDRFCLKYRHFVYDNSINPEKLGLQSYCPTVADLMRVSGVLPG
ncbi:NAD(P)-dependent oxidoreductase [Oscillatoria sp. CS-180]|uniref:NAD-dependent epimerase/dehydratase family protein n=1 Tax=Oscillatoria sp. CS-180 TaxID=3021720 RepID=UPI00232EC051|nr:NAD(P)-dependent oxidoreductase [Oscillatoria sp. CS-180]MDB9528336.1 NAD(P)-dependent oxidoreductase [Oscillatoria sp. CS-180]